jgi:hypothetical protein
MSDQKILFEDFTQIQTGTWSISGIGDTQLQVLGKGHITVTAQVNNQSSTRVIKDVLYVPGLGTNLFSIAAATNSGLEARFSNDMVSIHRDDELVLTGKRSGSTLYLLDLKPHTASITPTRRIDSAYRAGLRASLLVWHQRLGHMNHQTILKMVSEELVSGLHLTNEKIPKTLCAACELGKFHRQPLKIGRTRATRIGELVHSDVEGPMPSPSIGQARYYVLFTDDFSGWRVIYFMKCKSEVPVCFRLFIASLLSETGKTIRTLRSDNGGEYSGNDFKKFLTEKGIRHETSAANTPAQNGVAERSNRTLLDAARSILLASNLPSTLWAEAVGYVVYIRNRVLSSTIKMTPFEAWNGRKPDVSNIRTFGSRAFVRCPKVKKLDARCLEGAFVGISNTQKAFRIYISSPSKIIVSHDVKIDETVMYKMQKDNTALKWIETTKEKPTPTADSMDDTTTNLTPEADPADDPVDADADDAVDLPISTLDLAPASSLPTEAPDREKEQEVIVMENNENNSEVPIEVDDPAESTIGIRRSSRLPCYSEKYLAFRQSLGLPAVSFEKSEESKMCPAEPSSYVEAITGPDADHWIPAIFDEHESLIKNSTWTVCELPPDRKPIEGKWIFTFKPGYKEVAPRFKARFVAKGYSQIYGLDYVDTFSPVVKPYSLRTILAIAAAKDLEMIQLDIKTAFLNGDLQEEIYMKQPEGFVIPGKENQVCRLLKSLYGLKQASRAWNQKFHAFIMKFGLTQSKADPCVYFQHQREGEIDEVLIILIIYVDDGIILSNRKQTLTDILDHLKMAFEIRSLPAHRFIGVDIIRDRPKRMVYISQPEYIVKIAKKFNMSTCTPLTIPADPCCRLSPEMSPQNKEEEDEMKAVPYREAVGSLMHIMVMTRPDIAYAVGQVAQYAQKPGKQHWRAVKRILAYLIKTKNFGLHFGNTSTSLIGFCDADYAGDLQTRRSTSGFVFIHLGGPVSWASRRQPCVALSTTEAEFVAAADATKEAVWFQQLLSELGIDARSTTIYCDNQSAIALVNNPTFHQRTKHIDVRLFYIRELQESKKVNIVYLNTEQQIADILTKPLAAPRFEKLRDALGVILVPV